MKMNDAPSSDNKADCLSPSRSLLFIVEIPFFHSFLAMIQPIVSPINPPKVKILKVPNTSCPTFKITHRLI